MLAAILLLTAVANVAMAKEGQPVPPELDRWKNANRNAWEKGGTVAVWIHGVTDLGAAGWKPDPAAPIGAGWIANPPNRLQGVQDALDLWNSVQGLGLERLPAATPMATVKAETDIRVILVEEGGALPHWIEGCTMEDWGCAETKDGKDKTTFGFAKETVRVWLRYSDGNPATLDRNGVKRLALHELAHAMGVGHIPGSFLMANDGKTAAQMNADGSEPDSKLAGEKETAVLKDLWGGPKKAKAKGDGKSKGMAPSNTIKHMLAIKGETSCPTSACTSPVTQVVLDVPESVAFDAELSAPAGWSGEVIVPPSPAGVPHSSDPDQTVVVFAGGSIPPGGIAGFAIATATPMASAVVHTLSQDHDLDVFVVPFPPLTPPMNLVATQGPGNDQVSLTWDPPLSEEDEPTAQYRVDRDGVPVLATPDGTVTTATDSGLSIGTTYCYTVTSLYEGGQEGPPSDPACARTPGFPDPPRNLGAVAGSGAGEADLAWDPPLSDGGKPITHYRLYRDGVHVLSTADGTTTLLTDTGLDEDVVYCYTATAVNEIGEGASSYAACVTLGNKVQPHDAITRTFGASVFWEVEFKDPGLGIQSPTSPCPLVVYGLRGLVSHPTYYNDGREGTNFKMGSIEFPTGEPPVVVFPGPCPIPGSGPGSPTLLTVPDTNVYAPYAAVFIDQLLCGSHPSATCLPDPDLSVASAVACGKDDVHFYYWAVDDGRGVTSGTPSYGTAFSRWIACEDDPMDPSDGLRNPTTYYYGGPIGYTDDWFFDAGIWGTDFSLIQVEDLVPLGNGIDETGYLITCMYTTAVVLDPLIISPPSYTRSFATHDYRLVLDLDGRLRNWGEARLIHSFELAGWHDLGGKNGFPCPAGDDPPDKKGDFWIFPTPLSDKP